MTAFASSSAPATVQITYRAPGQLTVTPQRVQIIIGQRVRWDFESTEDVRFEIELHGTPFEDSEFRTKVGSSGVSTIDSGPATRPGDYKYDVKVRGTGGQHLADDDPFITVRPVNW